MTKADAARSMRADARRNREKLLAAAVELFPTAGPDASLDAVARRAGVAIGTLYRHFPTRDALVQAAYSNEVERVAGTAPELLRDHPPDVALAEWMERLVTYGAAKRGMATALRSVLVADIGSYADSRNRLVGDLTELLVAGALAGSIRADIEPEDVLRALGAIFLLTDEPDWSDRAHRLLLLLMDGLRYGA